MCLPNGQQQVSKLHWSNAYLRLTQFGTPWMARKSFGCSFHTVAEMLNFYWSTFQPDSGDFCKLVHILKLEINIHQVFGYYFSQCFFLQHCFQRSKRHLPPVSRLRKKTASNRLWLESLNISDCITGGMRLFFSCVPNDCSMTDS